MAEATHSAQALANVLHRKGKAHKSGNGWLTNCPAHEDEIPSLSLTDSDGRILYHCFAGCDGTDIANAVEAKTGFNLASKGNCKNSRVEGLAGHDVARTGKKETGNVVATYYYRDANHALLYRVERLEAPDGSKSFRQSRPHPTKTDCWLYNMEGVQRVLYRLPRVKEAIAQGEFVYLVEGEKCVHALEELGLCATTSVGGSHGWKRPWSAEYAKSLEGANVVIIPDNDEPGKKYTMAVGSSLSRAAVETRLLPLPQLNIGEDVVDWLAIGNTRDDLESLMFSARRYKRTRSEKDEIKLFQPPPEIIIQCMADVELKTREWLWQGRIPIGELTIIAGPGGVGKSTAAYAIAAACSTGGKLPGNSGTPEHELCQGPVLLLSAEDVPEYEIGQRLKQTDAEMKNVHVLTGWREFGEDDNDIRDIGLDDIAPLEIALKRIRPKLVVLDPIQSFVGAKIDMNKSNEMRPLLRGLAQLAERYKCAFVAIAHPPKQAQTLAMYGIAGSHEFSSVARSVLVITNDPESPDYSIIAQAKANLAGIQTSLRFYRGEGGFQWAGTSPLSADDLMGPERGPQAIELLRAQRWLDQFLQERGGQASADLIVDTAKHDEDISKTTLYRARDRLYIRSEPENGIRLWILPKSRIKGITNVLPEV